MCIECMIFFVSDQVDQGNLNVQYCLMDEMIGNFMTKPLQGSKFWKFWKAIFIQWTMTGGCWRCETQLLLHQVTDRWAGEEVSLFTANLHDEGSEREICIFLLDNYS